MEHENEKKLLDAMETKTQNVMKDFLEKFEKTYQKSADSAEEKQTQLTNIAKDVAQLKLTGEQVVELDKQLKSIIEKQEQIIKEQENLNKSNLNLGEMLKGAKEKEPEAKNLQDLLTKRIEKGFREADVLADSEDEFHRKRTKITALDNLAIGQESRTINLFGDPASKESKALSTLFLSNRMSGTNKALTDMYNSLNLGVGTVPIPPFYGGEKHIDTTVTMRIFDALPKRSFTSDKFNITIAYDYVDNAGTKAEGTAPSKSSIQFKVETYAYETISTYFKMSEEQLMDFPAALQEVMMSAPSYLLDVIDNKLLLSSTGAISGLVEEASAYTPGTYQDTLTNPYAADVYRVLKTNLRKNRKKFNTVIHGTDVQTAMELVKDANGNNMNDNKVNWVDGAIRNVCGATIVEAQEMGVNFLGGDADAVIIALREGLTARLVRTGTDELDGTWTIILKMRLGFAYKDKAAWLYAASMPAAILELDSSYTTTTVATTTA